MTLAGKTALVTGAANRIGAETVRTLHQNGANLIIHYRQSRDAAEALASLLNKERKDSCYCIQADLNNHDAVGQMFETIREKSQSLDILINNASTFYPTEIGQISEEQWQDLTGSNFKAPLFMIQAFRPLLTGKDACIINLIDIYADKPLKGYSLYCASKAANQSLVQSLALELAPDIRVNGVSPGAILWPDANHGDSDREAKIISQIPLGRIGQAAVIAKTVLFLIENDYITGEIIHVDGGRRLFSH